MLSFREDNIILIDHMRGKELPRAIGAWLVEAAVIFMSFLGAMGEGKAQS